jgi:hypothetical protein
VYAKDKKGNVTSEVVATEEYFIESRWEVYEKITYSTNESEYFKLTKIN